jgi:hypothetical protein
MRAGKGDRQMTAGAADRIARLVVAALIVAASAYLNFRYVLVHFSNGGDLLDTGWFAWIMASGDPWLQSPRGVSDLGYFNYHLTPYLSALTLGFHALGLDGFMALALHQGAMFALLTGSLCAIVLDSWVGKRSALLLAAVALFMLIGDLVLQITSFPHFEIAIPALCCLGAVLWLHGNRWPAAIAFLLACLVREDGGLYAGAFLFGLAVIRPVGRKTLSSAEAILAAATIVISLAMFWIKSAYFPGYPTFSFNFSGHGWDHLTTDFVVGRLRALALNPHALTALLPALVLAIFSRRYLAFPLLMLPIIIAQLLAARDQLGHFTAYYATPFLIIWAGLVLVAGHRARAGKLRVIEPAILLVSAIAGSGLLLYIVQPPAWLPVATTALATEVVDLPQLARDAASAVAEVPDACVSNGVAALIPNAFDPAQVITPGSDLTACRTIFLFNHDLHYDLFKPLLAGYVAGPVVHSRIERYDQRP